MKAMCLFALLLSLSAPAAHALQAEPWKITKLQLKAATLTKSDGTVIAVDPKEELVLDISLDTTRQHGSPETRQVKTKKVVLPAGGSPGEIRVDIESAAEQRCNPNRSGISFTMMGSHHAYVSLLAKPGSYKLIVNGALWGAIEITDANAKAMPDEAYREAVSEQYLREFSEVFGPLENFAVESEKCSARLAIEDGKVMAHFHFKTEEQTLPNGDILIKKEVREAFQVYLSAQAQCPSSRSGEDSGFSWTGTFSGDRFRDVARISVRSQKHRSASFQLNGRGCGR